MFTLSRLLSVWVNQYSVLHPNVPFGGVRQSGVGRELGPNGIENYLETKVRRVSTFVSKFIIDERIVGLGCSPLFRPAAQLAI